MGVNEMLFATYVLRDGEEFRKPPLFPRTCGLTNLTAHYENNGKRTLRKFASRISQLRSSQSAFQKELDRKTYVVFYSQQKWLQKPGPE